MAVTKSKPATVVALVSGWVAYKGASVLVLVGEARRADDPIVKLYPTFFGPQEVRIEAATAAPGEQR